MLIFRQKKKKCEQILFYWKPPSELMAADILKHSQARDRIEGLIMSLSVIRIYSSQGKVAMNYCLTDVHMFTLSPNTQFAQGNRIKCWPGAKVTSPYQFCRTLHTTFSWSIWNSLLSQFFAPLDHLCTAKTLPPCLSATLSPKVLTNHVAVSPKLVHIRSGKFIYRSYSLFFKILSILNLYPSNNTQEVACISLGLKWEWMTLRRCSLERGNPVVQFKLNHINAILQVNRLQCNSLKTTATYLH